MLTALICLAAIATVALSGIFTSNALNDIY